MNTSAVVSSPQSAVSSSLHDRISQTIAYLEGEAARISSLAEQLKAFLNGTHGTSATNGTHEEAQMAVVPPGGRAPKRPRWQKLLKISPDRKPRPELEAAGLAVTDVLRKIFAGWSGEFTNKMVLDQAIARYPTMEEKIKRGCGPAFKLLAKRGEVIACGREGRITKWKRGRAADPNETHRQIRAEIESKPKDAHED